MPYLFVYGSLKRGFPNHHVLGDARFIKNTVLIGGYDMYSLGGFPGIVPGSGRVHGEVYEISEDHLPRLDALEGYNEKWPREHCMYTREVALVPDGPEEEQEVFVYIWNDDVSRRTKIESGVWQ